MIFVLEKLPGFKPVDEGAFSRWVNSVARMFRMTARDAQIAHGRHDEYDEAVHTQPDDEFMDMTRLPAFERQVAELVLKGHSMAETATILNATPVTFRKKLQRTRHKIVMHEGLINRRKTEACVSGRRDRH